MVASSTSPSLNNCSDAFYCSIALIVKVNSSGTFTCDFNSTISSIFLFLLQLFGII